MNGNESTKGNRTKNVETKNNTNDENEGVETVIEKTNVDLITAKRKNEFSQIENDDDLVFKNKLVSIEMIEFRLYFLFEA